MLSANAQAFSVRCLLQKKETEKYGNRSDVSVRTDGIPSCRFGSTTTCTHSAVQTVTDKVTDRHIDVELCFEDLWAAFHRLGTEMIITKSGRRMFPPMRCRMNGLNPSARYRIYLDFSPMDKNKYRYVYHSSKWMVAGKGDNARPSQLYEHPDSPMTGSYIMNQMVSFERVKLTNNDRTKSGQISLLSMQIFQPRIHVIKIEDDPMTSHNSWFEDEAYVITFPQTSFIAVTAYQNQEITRLKIARNPFAKGFRVAGKSRNTLDTMMATYGVNWTSHASLLPRKRQRSETKSADYENNIKSFSISQKTTSSIPANSVSMTTHSLKTENEGTNKGFRDFHKTSDWLTYAPINNFHTFPAVFDKLPLHDMLYRRHNFRHFVPLSSVPFDVLGAYRKITDVSNIHNPL